MRERSLTRMKIGRHLLVRITIPSTEFGPRQIEGIMYDKLKKNLRG
jgi:hypothetical protein